MVVYCNLLKWALMWHDRIGSETGGGALMELKQEEDDDWDDDEAAPLPTLPQAQEEQRPPWQRTGQPPTH